MAEIRFTPEKLIEAGKKVEALHKRDVAYDFSRPDEEMEQLVRRLFQTPDDMLRAASMALSVRELHMLAGYLPYNYYDLPEQKLTEVLRYRMDENACRVLFREWQEEYTNQECNRFLRYLTDSNGFFRKLLAEHHISTEVYARILGSRNVPLAYDQLLIGGMFSDGSAFENKLRYYGVADGSFLDVECKRALLVFCDRSDYFSCSEENLLDIMKTYDAYMLRKFLLNFITRLSLEDLEMYPALASYMRQVTGPFNSRTFQLFFEGTPDDLVQRYIDWINIFKINMYFEEDERSSFWKQFRYLNVVRYPVSNVVILEFEEYAAVEFLVEKRGTVYICNKDVFMQQFYETLDRLDNEDLRAYFKEHRDQCEESRNHLGRWQSHLGNVLVKRGIAEKLED